MHRGRKNRVTLGVEGLEVREVPAVVSVFQSGTDLIVLGDDGHSNIRVSQVRGRVVVRDVEVGREWAYPVTAVGRVSVYAGNGHDRVSAGAIGLIPLLVHGNGGNDTILGGAGRDTVYSGTGNDHVDTGAGDDFADGDRGDDTLHGAAGHDTLRGGDGDDLVMGAAGHDALDGGDGNDYLFGGIGHDTLTGGDGADALFGEAGDDVLRANDRGPHEYRDVLVGGDGRDTFEANRYRVGFLTLGSDVVRDDTRVDRVVWL